MDQFLAVTGTGYDGLNLAAYGGKVNKFDGVDGDSVLSSQRPYNKTFETAREANAYLNYLRETG